MVGVVDFGVSYQMDEGSHDLSLARPAGCHG